MEQCQNHSGIVERIDAVKIRLDENITNQRRIHERIDALQSNVDNRFNEFGDKLTRYAEQMENQFAEAMRLFSDPKDGIVMGTNGVKSRVEDLARDQRMVFKFGGWLIAVSGTMIVFFREQLGRFTKWFFFGG